MARTEVVIQPSPRGASRTIDLAFPANINYAVGTSSIGGVWVNRQATISWTAGVNVGIGVPPAGTGWTSYRGRIAHKQTAGAGSGGYFATDSQIGIYFPQTKDAIGGNIQDDTRCWRVVLIAAFDHGLAGGDVGLEVGPNMQNAYNVIVGPNVGLCVRPTGNTTVGVAVSQGGALTINQDVAAVSDTANWNAYEMRFIGATAVTDAVWKVFVNNKPAFQASWGAGTLLPAWTTGGVIGYGVGVGNRGATSGAYTAQCGLRISAAATEAGLL